MGEVLMVGRQDLNIYPATIRKVLKEAGLSPDYFQADVPNDRFADPVFVSLGATGVSSLDASDFEGATYVHDLNQPIDDGLREKFDVVYDGGTLEHVFNFPQALRNCMEMVKEGGSFVTHTVINNWCGHGFYQFSPELFFSVLSPENGYTVDRMVVHIVGPYGRWYEVSNPQVIRSRVEMFNAVPVQMLVLARRTKVKPLFQRMPQQSDYSPRWDVAVPKMPEPSSAKVSTLAALVPKFARFMHICMIGWKMWYGHSLHNRKLFQPVRKKL